MNHFKKLENMYLIADCNKYFEPSIKIEHEKAQIEITVDKKFFHAAGAVHGSTYFKLLDDASFFAVNSVVEDYFVLTTSFTTYITRPITSGIMRSVGEVKSRTAKTFIAESIIYNEQNQEIARGNGLFVIGKTPLTADMGYK